MPHDYMSTKYEHEQRPQFVARTDIGKFGGVEWRPMPRDYAERELMDSRLADDDTPRGGRIHVSSASDRAWEQECERVEREQKEAAKQPHDWWHCPHCGQQWSSEAAEVVLGDAIFCTSCADAYIEESTP